MLQGTFGKVQPSYVARLSWYGLQLCRLYVHFGFISGDVEGGGCECSLGGLSSTSTRTDNSLRLRCGVCNACPKVHVARFNPHMLFICLGRDSNCVVDTSILGPFLAG